MPENRTNQTAAQQPEGEQGTLKHQNKRYAQGYAMTPNWVIRETSISRDAKLLYGILQSYASMTDNSFPGYEKLMQDMQCSRESLARYIKELKDSGLIEVERRGQGLTNVYTIVDWTREAYLDHQEKEAKKRENRARSTSNRTSRSTSKPNDKKFGKSNANKTKSKNTKSNKTKSFRKAHAFKTEKGGEEVTEKTRSHIAPVATRKRKEEAETREQKGRGVTFSPDKEGTTNKQDVQERAQQVTPALMIPKSVQENTERGTNGYPSTANQTPTQKRVAKHEAAKNRQSVYVGKPLTQEEIDEKRRRGQNASGFTPLSQIPPSHWQELETRSAAHPTNGNGNGHHSGAQNSNGLHYSTATTHAPDFIDALMEQFSKLLHDEVENIPQNINRAAKLYRQSAASEELFIASMHDAYTASKRKQKIATLHSDGRPNKMPYFFSVLADKLGVKPNQPT